MTIEYKILGRPGKDNALFIKVDTGQKLFRLLMDCGYGCLEDISKREVQCIDHLFFSHLHMDHVAGFDSFFRTNFNRQEQENHIWGPPETSDIMQHRFQGYIWNIQEEAIGTWFVHDFDGQGVKSFRLELGERFGQKHFVQEKKTNALILDTPLYQVFAHVMDHKTPCLAYKIVEKDRVNVNKTRMDELGLQPGPWLKGLKENSNDEHGLLIQKKGASLAYLTDFLLDDQALTSLSKHLKNCNTLVCEAQYLDQDMELAKKNFHMTTLLTAKLAREVNADELVLFHLSERYEESDWIRMLKEAQQIFPNTGFPGEWAIS